MILRATSLILAALIAALIVFRLWFLPDLIVRQMAVAVPLGDERPSDLGVAYENAAFDVDGDRLDAWFVEPPQAKPLAFLLFHGDGETISDWIKVQKLLHDRGFSSLIYDYAGYGDSEGRPSTRMFGLEPRAALAGLLGRIGPDAEVILLGHSMGAAVAVEAFHDFDEPRVKALIFNSGPSAFRDMLVDVLNVPPWLSRLAPQIINARGYIGDFAIPVLVISSEADEVVPVEMVRRVYAGATEPKDLVIWEDAGHNALTDAGETWWAPIFDWVDNL